MKYNYIKWNKEEKCAIFFPDIDYSLWKKTQLKENAYNNPSLIISSCLITKMDILELFEYYILFICGKSMGVSRWECNNLILLGTCCRRKNKISIWKNKTSIKVEILFFYKP